jgi:hypothetical protein
LILDALIATDPTNDLVPKLAKGLLAARRAGRWLNTQENAFVLLGLGRYFEKYESATPDFVADCWIGDRHAGRHEFRGRSVDRQAVRIPMSYLLGLGIPRTDLLIAKTGSGRLYYRLGLRYALTDLRSPPTEQGLAVDRTYEPVEAPGDVTRAADGSWRIRRGALVRTRVYLAAPARRAHVALVDPLPAGFEAVNTELSVTPSLSGNLDLATMLPQLIQMAGRQGMLGRPIPPAFQQLLLQGFGSPGPAAPNFAQLVTLLASSRWYSHKSLRDDRVEAYATVLGEGIYTLIYVSRATTSGQFVVPPARAEEMYDPETFGRSAADRVVVY